MMHIILVFLSLTLFVAPYCENKILRFGLAKRNENINFLRDDTVAN